MATKLGPSTILEELDFSIDAGSNRSYPRGDLAPYWVDYSAGLANGRYSILGPDSIYMNTTFSSWIGRFEAFMSSSESYTIMFDHVSDASSQIILDNDSVDNDQWNATISSSTTKQTYQFTRTPAQVSSTTRIGFYIRRNSGGNITISNFRFFKTSPTYDLIGSNNASLINGAGFGDFDVRSFELDGTNDYLGVGVGTGLNRFSGDFSVSVWAKRGGGSGFGSLIADYYTGTVATTNEWQLMMGASSEITFYRVGSGSIFAGVASGGTVSGVNKWVNVVVTRLGSTIKLYSNGSVIGTATNTTTFGTSTGNLNIGIDGNNSSEAHNGEIASVAISNNKGLTAAEVLHNYNSLKNRFI
jgi:hypothetical protein